MEDILRFDIYKVSPGCVPQIVESVEGLLQSKTRMGQLAAQMPGRYYLWNYCAREIVCGIDTTPPFHKKAAA